jgi:hypothetical protein
LDQHGDRVVPGTATWTEMPGSTKLEREIQEQLNIDDDGGVGEPGNVANKRNSIGAARLKYMPPGYTRP